MLLCVCVCVCVCVCLRIYLVFNQKCNGRLDCGDKPPLYHRLAVFISHCLLDVFSKIATSIRICLLLLMCEIYSYFLSQLASEMTKVHDELSQKISEIRRLQMELHRRDNDETDNMVESLKRTISDLEKENRDLKVAVFS